ncbi:hypothetical protein PoB_006962800 [Plakobranchus ocellatus]|uniref:Uncharacterized protein n=1 Tax=Plakobranchus ocellatus TaxID=259542 RepID=A0AAV4DFX1_9GAST|nr:hypothetical protein PoB_006962800 [Plakobranchus ocellatus]
MTITAPAIPVIWLLFDGTGDEQGCGVGFSHADVQEETMERAVKRTVAFTVLGVTTLAMELMDHVTKDVILVTYHHCALKVRCAYGPVN